ncbi:MAG: GNAT family N-acetyltransferase [Planctomycetota bacterium]
MAYQIEVCNQLEPFFDEPRIWDSLSGGIAFRESAWLHPWWQHLGNGYQAYLVVAKKPSGQICGLLPLYRKTTAAGRTLCFLGDGNTCTDYVSILTRPDEAKHVGESIGRFLAENSSGGSNAWDLIDIDGIVEGDVGMTALATGLNHGGATIHTVSRMRTWFKPADASWDEHLKHYGKTHRRKMRRMREKLAPEGPIERLFAKTESEVDEYLSALIGMHQRRWNSDGQPGSFADPNFCSFIRDAAKRFLQNDRLYLNLLRYEGRNISAELNFVGENRVLYSYSSGYDLDSAKLEPGRLCTIDVLLELYRSNLAGIDFMRGDEAYKTRLASSSRRVLRMRVAPPAFVPRLRHAAWCTGFEVKQWVRKRTGRTPLETVDLTFPGTAASNPA